jgi:hypothetical protein
MGFTKLDEGIVQSSIMGEDPVTFKVWITLLAMCKENGIAFVSPVFLSSVCRLEISQVRESLRKLSDIDENSRSKNDEGRRIREVQGGFQVINYLTYRTQSLRGAEAERKRLYREEKKEASEVVRTKPDDFDSVRNCPDASASAICNLPSSSLISYKGREWEGISSEDMEAWSKAYPACDLKSEFSKMSEWLIANPKKAVKSNWRRFIVNWLSRSQDKGGSMPSVLQEYKASQIGASAKREHSDAYWAEVRRLKEKGITGAELTAVMAEWKETP